VSLGFGVLFALLLLIEAASLAVNYV